MTHSDATTVRTITYRHGNVVWGITDQAIWGQTQWMQDETCTFLQLLLAPTDGADKRLEIRILDLTLAAAVESVGPGAFEGWDGLISVVDMFGGLVVTLDTLPEDEAMAAQIKPGYLTLKFLEEFDVRRLYKAPNAFLIISGNVKAMETAGQTRNGQERTNVFVEGSGLAAVLYAQAYIAPKR